MTMPAHFQQLPEASAYIRAIPDPIEGRLLSDMVTAFFIQQKLSGPPHHDVDMLFVVRALHTWLGEREWIRAVLNGEDPLPRLSQTSDNEPSPHFWD
ncbi:MAG TPA: hypothetical protein VD886_02650 [Herpetosiphonaceae bacterium]|nr:hypothetical protein [Herpetosiphonaceae bacterium]